MPTTIPARRIHRLLSLLTVLISGLIAAITMLDGSAGQAIASHPALTSNKAFVNNSLSGATGGLPLLPLVSPTATIPPCGPAWRAVTSPLPPEGSGTLRSLSAISANDVWAVGYTGSPFSNPSALAMHWDGSNWTIVPVPGGSGQALYSVSGTSSNDIWAVGNSAANTLIVHWDGAQWTTLPSPNAGTISNWLYGVAAVSPDDAWAVGQSLRTQGSQSVILHWDGLQWSEVPAPNPNWNENALYAVSGIDANDIWAVGAQPPHYNAPITLHWDGVSWNVVSNPQTPIGEYAPNSLFAVDGTSSGDVWAVGSYRNNSWSRTLIERWDGSEWSIVPSADGNLAGDNELTGVAALSENDAWAVGWYLDNGGTGNQLPLIQHWDGTAWSQVAAPRPQPVPADYKLYGVARSSPGNLLAVGSQAIDTQNVGPYVVRYSDPCITPSPTTTASPPTSTATSTPVAPCSTGWSALTSPNVGSSDNILSAVDSSSAFDGWAVGYSVSGSTKRTLALRWNGSQWTGVNTPNSGAGDNRLAGVAALSLTDAWAVGYYLDGSATNQTLALHWNGSVWTQVSTPINGQGGALNAVHAISANDIWAVGYYNAQNLIQPLTLHWNGTAWSVVATPAVPGFLNTLQSVSGSASNDVWAVGTQNDSSYPDTLAMHWNGSAWSLTPSPSPGNQYDDQLTGVSAVSPNEAWAVGHDLFSGLMRLVLVLRWDGSQWTVNTSPGVGKGAYLNGMSGNSSSNIWAVGQYIAGTAPITRTLALRWNGSTWGTSAPQDRGSTLSMLSAVEVVSRNEVWAVGYSVDNNGPARTLVERLLLGCLSPEPSPTVPTATPSPTGQPISTMTPTSTVTPGGATATATRTATRTATGLATSTTTRTATRTASTTVSATVSATVSGTPPATVTAVSSATAASTAVATATVCALSFSDVPEGSTFYSYVRCLSCMGIITGYPDGTFRPNNNVTRGQLSKIVSNSAGFSDDQPNQMFQDVPVGSTFQVFVGRLASRGYINGYPCGGPGEPCIPNFNLPYFRPNDSATRGQISKIDSNAAGFSDVPFGQQFEDVPVASTFYTYTYRLASRGVMAGYQCGGTGEPCIAPNNLPYFRPNNNATRGQTSKIVSNTFFPDCSQAAYNK